jgi:hypothetical protein
MHGVKQGTSGQPLQQQHNGGCSIYAKEGREGVMFVGGDGWSQGYSRS